MLAISISWIVILVIILPIGFCLLNIYNRIAGLKSDYITIVDVFLIGMGIVLIPVSILSLFFPVDFKILLLILAISLICICINRKEIFSIYKTLKKNIKNYSGFYLLSIFILVLSFMMIPIWLRLHNYDPLFYHYSNIKWNEYFAVVPGLANLEERFGFNSNYFLLSALFSLRFIFNDLIIGIQSLFAVLIGCWMLHEIVKNNFEIKRVTLFILYLLFIYINRVELATSSTDIIPNLSIIYLFSNVLLYPDRLKNPMVCIFIPIVLITFKLSNALLLVIGLYSLILMIKERKWNVIIFVFSICSMVMLPWLVRNIIISGYLIFPYWQLDLFTFDWKVPSYIPRDEQSFISEYARDKFIKLISSSDILSYKSYNFPIVISYLLSFVALILSPILVFVKKKDLSQSHIYIFICLILNYLFWLIAAPDIRFGYGFVFSLIYIMFFLIFTSPHSKYIPFINIIIESKNLKRKMDVRILAILLSTVLLFHLSFKWTSEYRYFLIDNFSYNTAGAIMKSLFKPIDIHEQKVRILSLENFKGKLFQEHHLNENIVIYTSNMKRGFFFDEIPVMRNARITYSGFIQDFENIEARGDNIQDGFRSKTITR